MKFNEKLAKFIVKARWYFFGIFLALGIASVFTMGLVPVNYELTKYLPSDSETRVSLTIMEEEFGSNGMASLVILDTTVEEVNSIMQSVAAIEGVSGVTFDSNSETSFKADPDDPTKNNALLKIFFTHGDYTQETEKAVNEIRALTDELNLNANMAGEAITSLDNSNAIQTDMLLILAIAVAIVLLVLLLTSKSWIEPLIYLIVIGVGILIGMGTNFLLGEISFVSQTISAVMLIALGMDYCIVLCSRFREEYAKDGNTKAACERALAASFLPILAASLTTILGLVALMFMSFTIGLDIGAVLSKGILICLLSVIFFMPSIIVLMSKLLEKTKHKTFLPKMDKVGTFAHKARWIMPIAFVGVVVTAICLQGLVQYSFAVDSVATEQCRIEQEKIEHTFGKQNTLVIMLPKGNPDSETEVYNWVENHKIDGQKYINSGMSYGKYAYVELNAQTLTAMGIDANYCPMIICMAKGIPLNEYQADMTITTEQLINFAKNNQQYLQYLSPEVQALLTQTIDQFAELDAMLNSEHYTRMIFNLNLSVNDPAALQFIKDLKTELPNFVDEYYLVNATANVLDMEGVFTQDQLIVNLISFFAIFLIVMLSFKSITIPILLTVAIQGAIWINLAINAIVGIPVFFICYLLAMAIQMGATIDYGILLTDRYKRARQSMNKLDAIKQALNGSVSTILTSGIILVTAAYTIHFVSRIALLQEIGSLIGRGALISIITVLFVLPSVLLIFDKVIEKTTWKANFKKKEEVLVNGESNNQSKPKEIVDTTAKTHSEGLSKKKSQKSKKINKENSIETISEDIVDTTVKTQSEGLSKKKSQKSKKTNKENSTEIISEDIVDIDLNNKVEEYNSEAQTNTNSKNKKSSEEN